MVTFVSIEPKAEPYDNVIYEEKRNIFFAGVWTASEILGIFMWSAIFVSALYFCVAPVGATIYLV